MASEPTNEASNVDPETADGPETATEPDESTLESAEETAGTEAVESEPTASAEETAETAPAERDVEAQLEALDSKLETLIKQVDTLEDTESLDGVSSALEDPELVHKTVESWLDDERFSKAEEAALLRALFS